MHDSGARPTSGIRAPRRHELVNGRGDSGPATLVAELDLTEIPRAEFDFDVVGHDARPDVFRVVVNTAATTPDVREP